MPKLSTARRTPRDLRARKRSTITSGSFIRTPSVISSANDPADQPEEERASVTSPATLSFSSWRAETLTETLIG